MIRNACRNPLSCLVAGVAILIGGLGPAWAAEREFPFEQELRLDARPMKGSKRVPLLEIGPKGEATIDLWCDTMQGQAIVVDNTITILPGEKSGRNCTPEQARGDEDIVSALTAVTNWRRDGYVVTLIGPTTLRFRLPTN